MRKFTRVLCLCLMLALIFSLGMPAAFAEGTEPEEVEEPVPTPTPEVPEPTSTPEPKIPSPYVEPKFPCLHLRKDYTVDEASTCSKTGSGHWVCKDCGATDTYSIPKNPLAHNPSATNIISGSFIDETHTVQCSDCGLKWAELHSRVIDSEKPATCLEDGHSAGVYCADGCGYDTRIVYSAPGEHSWGEWTVKTPATCTKDGLEIRKCSKCTATEERTIAAEGHKPVAISDRAPTCTEDGSVGGKKCSVCQAVLEEPEVVPATGHDWGLWADAKDGWRHVRFCANDPTHKQYGFHKMGNWITVKQNTETTDGYRERWCQEADCDYHEVQVIRAGSPKTGDSSNILFYSGLCLASLCAASGLIVFAKRRKEQ